MCVVLLEGLYEINYYFQCLFLRYVAWFVVGVLVQLSIAPLDDVSHLSGHMWSYIQCNTRPLGILRPIHASVSPFMSRRSAFHAPRYDFPGLCHSSTYLLLYTRAPPRVCPACSTTVEYFPWGIPGI